MRATMSSLLLSFLTFILLLSNHAKANEDEIDPLYEGQNALEILSAEPSTFVYNCVNVTSGDYVEFCTDLAVPGAEPLTLQRFFCSADTKCSTPFRAWKFNHDIYAYHPVNHFKSDIILNDAFGAKIPFHFKRYTSDWKVYGVHPDLFDKCITNTASPKNGRYHLKNRTLQRHLDEEQLVAEDGAGVKYHFNKPRKKSTVPLLLQKKSNGNELRYGYRGDKTLKEVRKEVRSLNSNGILFGSLHFSEHTLSPYRVKLEASTNGGNRATYDVRKWDKGWKLHGVESTQKPAVKYSYDEEGRFLRKERPDFRFLEMEYYGKKGHKVKALKAPAGKDATPIELFRFFYHVMLYNKDYLNRTDVHDAYDHLTTYEYNKEERLHNISHFSGQEKDRQLYSQELFYWGAAGTRRAGDLLSKVFADAENNPIFCRTYEYDSQGNLLTDSLYGNLTGSKKASLKVDEDGKPVPGSSEALHLKYQYNDRHLVTFENHAEYDHDIKYVYYDGTDLLKARYTLEGATVRLREFFFYDANGALINHTTDDGSAWEYDNLTGVTERHVKRIKNTSSFPLGLPEMEEVCYLDVKSNRLYRVSRKVNQYNEQGRLGRQEVYDNQNILAYTLEWKYDAHGNVIEETNALGQRISRQFDANGNRIFEQGPDLDSSRFYTYDYMDRLIKVEERGTDGIHLSTHYNYDYLGNKTSCTDIYGNETHTVYDDFDRVQKVVKATGTEERAYDLMGYVTHRIEAGGAKTIYSHTLRGNPYHIINPDGSQEFCEYTLKGLLKKEVSPHGSYRLFTYDYNGRPVLEETWSPSGEKLQVIKRVYNAFHLLQETDAMGVSTNYRYDSAGRLIRKERGNSATEYGYDSLGRQSKKQEIIGNGKYLDTVWTYDVLDRLLSETLTDETGKGHSYVSYVYDEADRRTEVITVTSSGMAIEKTAYNSHGDPISFTDPLGHTTYTRYHYDKNSIEVTDPQGRTSVSTYGEEQRLISQELRNPLGQTIKKQAFAYDSAGHKIRQTDTVFDGPSAKRDYKVQWEYNAQGQLVRLIEGVGTTQPKITQYGYNKNGQAEVKIKPDGQKLQYRYDTLGRLKEQFSSDKSVHYSYTYDAEDYPVLVEDLAHRTTHRKKYDALHRLVEETFNHGLKMGYAYDPVGRVTDLHLPDGSSIHYTYQGPHPHQVIRKGLNQTYTHTYESFDLQGPPTQATLIGNAGQRQASYDLLGRRIRHTASLVKEELKAHDSVGNLLSRTVQDALGTCASEYTYDPLDQLQSEGDLRFSSDSLHNILAENQQKTTVNALNQLTAWGECQFTYDLNGCRISKKSPSGKTEYGYDAKGRLSSVLEGDRKTVYQYDESDRRLSKTSYRKEQGLWKEAGAIRYLYWGKMEIGACDAKGRLMELKVPGDGIESVAFELQGEVFAPVYDHAGHVISLLKAEDGTVYETYRYSAYGQEQIFDAEGREVGSSINPWRYAGKRTDEETGFIYYGMRYYDPQTCRWLTPDPAGFVDGLNLYTFLLNNPLRYTGLDGRIAIVLPLVLIGFGMEFTVSYVALGGIINALFLGALVLNACTQDALIDDNQYTAMYQEAVATEEEETKKKGRKRGNDNEIQGGPPRDKNANYLPDPAAEGTPHTTLGTKEGSHGPYKQGATFDEDGKFKRRTDVTDHGRRDHPNPHYHQATSPNGANSPPEAIKY